MEPPSPEPEKFLFGSKPTDLAHGSIVAVNLIALAVVQRKERTYEEDLEHQVEMLRAEVSSVRSDLEKYKNNDDCKSDTPKDELTF